MKDVVHTLTITRVPQAALDIVWPDTKEFIQKAIDHGLGEYELHDVEGWLSTADMALWTVNDGTKPIAAFTTRVCQYPKRRDLVIDFVGGERLEEWLEDATNTLNEYAKVFRCQHISSFGRLGWSRHLRKLGWSQGQMQYTVPVKEAEDE